MLTIVFPMMFYGLSAGGGGSNNSMSSILSLATELLTWLITSMTSLLTFISSNPIILVFFIMTIAGFGISVLMRIWHSV